MILSSVSVISQSILDQGSAAVWCFCSARWHRVFGLDMFYSLSHISPWIWSPVLRGLICLLFFRAEAELTFLHAFAKVLQRLIFLLLMHFVTFLTSRLQFSPSLSVWIFLCSHLSVPLINYKKNSRAAWWFDGRLHEIVFVSAVFL